MESDGRLRDISFGPEPTRGDSKTWAISPDATGSLPDFLREISPVQGAITNDPFLNMGESGWDGLSIQFVDVPQNPGSSPMKLSSHLSSPNRSHIMGSPDSRPDFIAESQFNAYQQPTFFQSIRYEDDDDVAMS